MLFLATTLLGEWGDDRMNPKSNQKLLLGARSYVTITRKGFFTQSQVLLSSIVELRSVSCSVAELTIVG